jgi:hypothetical protein
LDSIGTLATGTDTAVVSADTATGGFRPAILRNRPGSSFSRGAATGATAAGAAATDAVGFAADFFRFSFASAMKILLV